MTSQPEHKCRYCEHEGRAGRGGELACEGLGGTRRLYACKDAGACGERIRQQTSLREAQTAGANDLPF